MGHCPLEVACVQDEQGTRDVPGQNRLRTSIKRPQRQ